MVNVRLLDFFDKKGALSTLQYAGVAKRKIIDQVLSLEATVGSPKQTVSKSNSSSSTLKKYTI